jgi:hypothetical protein
VLSEARTVATASLHTTIESPVYPARNLLTAPCFKTKLRAFTNGLHRQGTVLLEGAQHSIIDALPVEVAQDVGIVVRYIPGWGCDASPTCTQERQRTTFYPNCPSPSEITKGGPGGQSLVLVPMDNQVNVPRVLAKLGVPLTGALVAPEIFRLVDASGKNIGPSAAYFAELLSRERDKGFSIFGT